MDFDIAIVGGGIAGASLGAEVAARATTLIVEAEDQCGHHSTGRSAAFYLESYGGPEVAKLNRASEPLLRAPPLEFAEHGFLRRRGAIHLSRDAWPELPEGVQGTRLERPELERRIPGLRPEWRRGLFEPGCADIDVAALHAAFLAKFRRRDGEVRCGARVLAAERAGAGWRVRLGDGAEIRAGLLVDAAGAWSDTVAVSAGVTPIGLQPMRRTMVQLRVGQSGLRDLPLIMDRLGTFYFKGESDRSIWLSPHDETASAPCDAAPEEIDVATAIGRFEQVVDWPAEQVERRWAGLRTFAPDRLPVYGFDPQEPRFFWCAGQGGFGIQTAPAAARLAAAQLLGESLPEDLTDIDPRSFEPRRFVGAPIMGEAARDLPPPTSNREKCR